MHTPLLDASDSAALASAQLHTELRASVHAALASRRPVLHHLNADSSWLLQLPRPWTSKDSTSSSKSRRTAHVQRRRRRRHYYNILIDPWLAGGQSDVASWFSQQFHAAPSAVASVAEVEELAREMEELARETFGGAAADGDESDEVDDDSSSSSSLIDAVAVSHEFTDHCHKETLLQVHRDVPVFAIGAAARLIAGWHHFRSVIPIAPFAGSRPDWRETSTPPLPSWLGIGRLVQTEDVLDYHAALLIAFTSSSSSSSSSSHDGDEAEEDAAEAIVYTPHGIHAGDLEGLGRAAPSVRALALLHGLHAVRVGTAGGRTALQSNLGAHNGLAAQRAVRARHWIGTHDEVKTGGGLVAWFLQRDVISLPEALRREREAKAREGGGGGGDGAVDDEMLSALDGVNWAELGNGESRVLV